MALDMLIACWRSDPAPPITMAARIESGMDTAITSVCRQLPRNRRIISAVNAAAMTASFTTPSTAALTKIDWSKSGWIFNSGGSVRAIAGSAALTCLTMSIVDATPVL